ncbi:MAG: hypothetical protein AAFX79_02245 [Planctomycetota bacterium]
MPRWIRRALWCGPLGFATAWLVAWGVTVGMWTGWYRPASSWLNKGIGVVEPWLLKKSVNRCSVWTSESWSGDRLDRVNALSESNRRRADRVLELGGAAYAEELERQTVESLPGLEKMLNRPPGSMTEAHADAKANMPPIRRIDDQIVSFPPPNLAQRVAATQADSFVFYARRVGWPSPMLEGMEGVEITVAKSGIQQAEVTEGQITIDALNRAPLPGMQPTALALPYRVLPSAAIANTAFFAASWFAALTAIALARALRHKLAGRCPRCGYDLRRIVGPTCPECG